jgi:hypothetical protein
MLRIIGDVHTKFTKYVDIISNVDRSVHIGDFGIGFNPVTMTVYFCGRLWHFQMIQKGYLEGINEDDVFGFGEKPGAKDRDWTNLTFQQVRTWK